MSGRPLRVALVRYGVAPASGAPMLRVLPEGWAPIDLSLRDRVEIETEDQGTFVIRFDRKPIPKPSDAEMVAEVRAALEGFALASRPDLDVWTGVLRRLVGMDPQ